MARIKNGAKKGSGFSVSRILEVATAGRESLRAADEDLLIRVHVDPACPRSVALAVKEGLVPTKGSARVQVRSLTLMPGDETDCDLVLVLSGADGEPAAKMARAYAKAGVPCGIVVESALDLPNLGLPDDEASLVGCVAASSAESLLPKLAVWMVSATDKGVALAATFPFCRKAEVEALVFQCALENAAIGAVALVPGSDFPLMTANQAKLAFDIAGAYGAGLSPERALELAGVVAAGLGYRTLARTFAGLVPGFGWVVKAGIAYAGTVTTAKGVETWLSRDEKKAAPSKAPYQPAAEAIARLPKRTQATAPKDSPAADQGFDYLTIQ